MKRGSEQAIFFATDLHGSDRCFKKLSLISGSIFGADPLSREENHTNDIKWFSRSLTAAPWVLIDFPGLGDQHHILRCLEFPRTDQSLFP